MMQPLKFTKALSIPLFVVLLVNKLVPLVGKFSLRPLRSHQNLKISIFTKFQPSELISALQMAIFAFRLVNKLGPLVAKLKNRPH